MVGHSSLASEAFLEILRTHRIDVLCDVRAWPSSRRWPHFDLDCAEKDWRQCHRRHIADHLIALEDVSVLHILGPETPRPHRLDPKSLSGRLHEA